MKKLDPTTKNKIDNLIKTAKQERNALVIRERDKWFAKHNTKFIQKAYSCIGILVKSTQPGTAYCHVPEDKDAIPTAENILSTNTGVYGNDIIHAISTDSAYLEANPDTNAAVRITYRKGSLQVLTDFNDTNKCDVLIKPEQIESIEKIHIY